MTITIGKKSQAVTETKTCVSITDSTKTKNVGKDENCPTGYKEKGTTTTSETNNAQTQTNNTTE